MSMASSTIESTVMTVSLLKDAMRYAFGRRFPKDQWVTRCAEVTRSALNTLGNMPLYDTFSDIDYRFTREHMHNPVVGRVTFRCAEGANVETSMVDVVFDGEGLGVIDVETSHWQETMLLTCFMPRTDFVAGIGTNSWFAHAVRVPGVTYSKVGSTLAYLHVVENGWRGALRYWVLGRPDTTVTIALVTLSIGGVSTGDQRTKVIDDYNDAIKGPNMAALTHVGCDYADTAAMMQAVQHGLSELYGHAIEA